MNTFHHLGMWLLVVFSMIHIYAAVREDILSRQTMIATMTNVWRFFKDDRP